MKYITIAANYMTSGIKDDFEGELTQDDLKVDQVLWDRLSHWSNDYSEIISKDLDERDPQLIKQLDIEGLLLVEEFKKALGSDFKIRYYSEGLLKYL